jgi:uncharacterized protein (TIGR00730 family)
MHERKRRMFELSDAFVTLPGGLGTMDETFEIITWKQLKLHDKPIVIADIAGYWAPLRHLIEHVIAKGFAQIEALTYFHMVPRVDDILPTLESLSPPTLPAEPKLV